MGTATFSRSDYSTPGEDPVNNLLSKLKNVKRSGKGWTAQCPAHEDRHNSVCIGVGTDGRALVDCKAGCEAEDVVARLGMTMASLFPVRQTKDRAIRGTSIPPAEQSTLQQSVDNSSCTLASYATEKKLPEPFLQGLGLSNCIYMKQPALRIPYFDKAGMESATRYRTTLHKSQDGDNRFKWKTGAKPCPYGLWRLEAAYKAGYVVLCEGESDAQTLWFHNIPALGIPGADSWREDWAEHLIDTPTIFVVIEPDKGGEAVRKWLAKSQIKDRVLLIELGQAKDPSGLYLQSPEDFPTSWTAAMKAAIPWTSLEQSETQLRMQQAWNLCRDLAEEPDILGKFAEALATRGVAGESRAAKLVYLGVTSRFLDRPVSVALKGPSSAGKSFTVEQTLSFFPMNAYYALSAMSERALAYSQEPLKHRILVIYESAGMSGDFASYLVRSLLSEGRVRYETVEKTSKGLQPRLMEREGPTGLIVTTTAISLHPENETRMLSIPVADTQDQTRRVLLALADESRSESNTSPTEWVALQEWLDCAEHTVTIPYARTLAEAVPAVAVRLRRDFNTLLSLIRAHAILHQMTRFRDEDGRIVASVADYAAVRALVADLISEGVEVTVSKVVRETVEAVRALGGSTDATISIAQLAAHLKLDKGAVSRRVKACLASGYLQNLETGKGKAAKLIVGDDLPDDQQILPLPEQLGFQDDGAWECCSVDDLTTENDTPDLAANDVSEARWAGWIEIPPGPVPGAGVYRFDESTRKTYKRVIAS